MNTEPKEIIVLGTIKAGINKFEQIQKIRHVDHKVVGLILEKSEKKGFVKVKEKKVFIGTKIEIGITDKVYKEIEKHVHELQTKWNQMSTLHKTEDKENLKQFMDVNKSLFPMMIFFGIIDVMMFSSIFDMIGIAMSDYVPAESMPKSWD